MRTLHMDSDFDKLKGLKGRALPATLRARDDRGLAQSSTEDGNGASVARRDRLGVVKER